jgi:hypothetical protein
MTEKYVVSEQIGDALMHEKEVNEKILIAMLMSMVGMRLSEITALRLGK